MSRRARTRRDKRAPIPDFDQPEDNQAARKAPCGPTSVISLGGPSFAHPE